VFRVQGLGFGVQGLGLMVKRYGFRVLGLGFKVRGFGSVTCSSFRAFVSKISLVSRSSSMMASCSEFEVRYLGISV
jgi:hypothetical protein